MMNEMMFRMCPTRIVNDATSWFRRPTTPAVNPMMVWGMIAANSYGAAPVPKNTALNEVPTRPSQGAPGRSEKDASDDDNHHIDGNDCSPADHRVRDADKLTDHDVECGQDSCVCDPTG